MRAFLEFDDAGASDDELVKGITMGDIRAWHDEYHHLFLSQQAMWKRLETLARERPDRVVRWDEVITALRGRQ